MREIKNIKDRGIYGGIIYILDRGIEEKWEHCEMAESIIIEIIEPFESKTYDKGFVDGIRHSFLNKIKKLLKIGWYR